MHALTMLAADGAFTYAGAKLSNEAETSAVKRRRANGLCIHCAVPMDQAPSFNELLDAIDEASIRSARSRQQSIEQQRA